MAIGRKLKSNCRDFLHPLSLICYLLFVIWILIFLAACGKKGDPTLKLYERPDAPSELRAIHRESEIILLWDFPKNKEQALKGFHLLRSILSHPTLTKGGRGDFEKIAFLENDKRSYRDEDFQIGFQYRYKIISQNLKGVTSLDSSIIEVEPKSPLAPPGRPQFKIEHDLTILTWEVIEEDKIFYNVYKSFKKGLYPLFPVNTEPIKETSFRDSFDITKPVYYTIRSLRGGDIWDEGAASEELEINSSDFVPPSPEGLQAVPTEKGIQMIWEEVPETWIIGYRVYREIDEKEGYVLIGEIQTPAFMDIENPLMKRNYRVTALGPTKESTPSEIRDIVFIPYR